MKNILKLFFSKLGYRFVKVSYYQNWVNINTIDHLDFYYKIKSSFKKDQKICCFDIGANIGQTAKKMRMYFPLSNIYCFEPVQSTYQLLSTNLLEYSNMNVYNLALGSTQGELEIFHREDSEWNSLVKGLNEGAKNSGATSEFVKIDTIDNFVTENNIAKIDILKIDTEGFEMEVLKGAKNCLEKRIIEILYIEVGFNKNDIQHSFFSFVLEELEKYDYGFSGLFEKSFTPQNTILYANALFCKRNSGADKCLI